MLIPNLGFGGAQRVFHDHGQLLARRYRVTETVFNLDDGHAFPGSNRLVSLDVFGGGGPFAKLAHLVSRVRRLAALKRQLRPALTISHLEGADYINVLAGGGGKRLLCIHGSKLHDANIRGALGVLRKRLLIPMLYNRADRIITVAHEIAIELEQLGVRRDKIRTIHNFFDPSAIAEQSLEPLSLEEQAMFAGPPVLVTSGRLTLQKNHSGLIAAFAELLNRRPSRLLLLGDGELRQPLIQQARALGLRVGEGAAANADVTFMGFQANPFRLQRYAAAFVLSSGWEGFPMVLGEAMACGLPIVAADCPTGPREFLAPATIDTAVRPLRTPERGDHGLLMPVPAADDLGTLRVWVNALDRLLSDGEERAQMARQSLARAADFSRERIAPQWLALIDELLASLPESSA